jgi:hypothetical protein
VQVYLLATPPQDQQLVIIMSHLAMIQHISTIRGTCHLAEVNCCRPGVSFLFCSNLDWRFKIYSVAFNLPWSISLHILLHIFACIVLNEICKLLAVHAKRGKMR